MTTTNAANRDYAVPVYSALDADAGFLEVSNGFAGRPSDGLTQLDADRRADQPLRRRPRRGNLVQTARVDLPRDGEFELALGFGRRRPARRRGRAAACASASATSAAPTTAPGTATTPT